MRALLTETPGPPWKGVILSAGKDPRISPQAPRSFGQTTAIALGSNLPSQFGTPADNLREALRRLADLGKVTAVSSFYETAPVGYLPQPNFVNAAVLLQTLLAPLELLHALLGLEQAMGRDRSAGVPAKGPRIIDLDLLWYGDLILAEPELTLPHPALHERRFVLKPLAEIAPHWVHPLRHLSAQDMLDRCTA